MMRTWMMAWALAVTGAALGATGCGTNCHDEGDGCVDHHGSTGNGGQGGSGGSDTSLAQQYCDCMLVSCHDAYHQAFGPDTDEAAARENCLAEAESLPVAGMDVDSGNFIECRIHHCELAKSDETVCPSAIGEDDCSG